MPPFSPVRRPHKNLEDDGIWRQRASFSAKTRLLLGFLLVLFCKKSLNQKPRFGAKERPLRADSHMVNVDMEFAPFGSVWLRLLT